MSLPFNNDFKPRENDDDLSLLGPLVDIEVEVAIAFEDISVDIISSLPFLCFDGNADLATFITTLEILRVRDLGGT